MKVKTKFYFLSKGRQTNKNFTISFKSRFVKFREEAVQKVIGMTTATSLMLYYCLFIAREYENIVLTKREYDLYCERTAGKTFSRVTFHSCMAELTSRKLIIEVDRQVFRLNPKYFYHGQERHVEREFNNILLAHLKYTDRLIEHNNGIKYIEGNLPL